jgi:hypothetical protein
MKALKIPSKDLKSQKIESLHIATLEDKGQPLLRAHMNTMSMVLLMKNLQPRGK